jgi:hypothetical protein
VHDGTCRHTGCHGSLSERTGRFASDRDKRIEACGGNRTPASLVQRRRCRAQLEHLPNHRNPPLTVHAFNDLKRAFKR